MTLSQNYFRSFIMAVTAILMTSVIFTTTTAEARTKTVAYTAELASPVEADSYVIRDVAVYCDGTECKAAKSSSSARSVCAGLVKEVGPVTAFSYRGKAFDAAQLEKCNG